MMMMMMMMVMITKIDDVLNIHLWKLLMVKSWLLRPDDDDDDNDGFTYEIWQFYSRLPMLNGVDLHSGKKTQEQKIFFKLPA